MILFWRFDFFLFFIFLKEKGGGEEAGIYFNTIQKPNKGNAVGYNMFTLFRLTI